jgi:hypothetical protein
MPCCCWASKSRAAAPRQGSAAHACCERTTLLRARMLGTLGCPGCYRMSSTWLVCKHLPSNIRMALGDQDPLTTCFKRDSSCS